MEKLFFSNLLHSYKTLAQALNISTAEQVRMWDKGMRNPSLANRLKILHLLQQKRNALSRQIQDLEELWDLHLKDN